VHLSYGRKQQARKQPQTLHQGCAKATREKKSTTPAERKQPAGKATAETA